MNFTEITSSTQVLRSTWFAVLPLEQQQLIRLAFKLLEVEKTQDNKYADYSFIIFPMSKAYEGFLKHYFYSLGMISKKTFEGKRFRIGRALNPDIREYQQDEYWIYDDIEQMCSKEIAQQLWQTWLECRNQVFHYFAKKPSMFTIEQAEKKVLLVATTIAAASECKRELNK